MLENDHYTILDRMYDYAPRRCDICSEETEGKLYEIGGLNYCGACLRAWVDDMSDDDLAEAVGATEVFT